MLKRILDGYYRFLQIALTVLMFLLIVPVCMQVLSRYTGLIPPYIWTEEAARFCFMWIIMLGAMIAVRDGSHFDVDLLPKPKTLRGFGVSKLIVHLIIMIVGLVFVIYGYEFAKWGFMQHSEMSGINMLAIYVAWPLAGLTWILFLIEKIIEDFQYISGKKKGWEDVPG